MSASSNARLRWPDTGPQPTAAGWEKGHALAEVIMERKLENSPAPAGYLAPHPPLLAQSLAASTHAQQTNQRITGPLLLLLLLQPLGPP